MANFYVDTSIWFDYIKDRRDGIRPLGEFAFQLFKRVRKEKHTILFSRLLRKEISRRIDYGEFEKFVLNDLGKLNLIKEVQIAKEQIQEAEKISSVCEVPESDCLHAILARDNNAII